jgi:hypothetical protein
LQAVYDPNAGEILLAQQRHGDLRLTVLRGESGTVSTSVRLEGRYRFQSYRSAGVPINKKHLLVQETARPGKQENLQIRRRFRLVRRQDGRIVPDVILPRREDVASNRRNQFYTCFRKGEVLIFVGSGGTFAYGHRDAADG